MKKIGIKLADGTFHPILEEGITEKQELNLTTVNDGQTIVKVDLYRSETSLMDDAEYIDTLELSNLKKHPNGEPNINLNIWLDQDGHLSAELADKESGAESRTSVSLLSARAEKTDGIEENKVDGVKIAETVEEPPIVEESVFAEEPSAKENATTEEPVVKETAATEDTFSASDLPSMDELNFDLPEPSFSEEPTTQDAALPDFELPEFPETSFDESAGSQENFDLPDFNDDSFLDNDTDSFADSSRSTSDDFSSDTDSLDFSDLYDEESEEENSNKGQKLTMIICFVCALVCVLALFAMFFIAPTVATKEQVTELFSTLEKIELTMNKKSQELIAPPAKENEVIVITDAKAAVPDFSRLEVERKSEPKVINYKVKWGDTLWDLADAYYKNPWLYTKIAKYNNIKNPNYIRAGSYIRISEE